jgi:hypothetical protein
VRPRLDSRTGVDTSAQRGKDATSVSPTNGETKSSGKAAVHFWDLSGISFLIDLTVLCSDEIDGSFPLVRVRL